MRNSVIRRKLRAFGIDEAVKTFSGAVILWNLFPDRSKDDVASLRQGFSWLVWHRASLRKRLYLIGGFILWPLLIPGVAVYYTRRNGPAVRDRTGKSLPRQFGEQMVLAARHAILPPWYYIYDLHEREKRARARDYLNRFEMKRCIYPFLRDYYADSLGLPRGGSRMAVSNKLLFLERCRAHGFPTAPILLVAEQGMVRTPDGADAILPQADLPAIDLFVKPIRGCGGRGATRWTYQADGRYHANSGATLDAAGLVAELERLSRQESHIVQPRLTNHATLRELTPGALCTVRALTCRDEHGGFELTHAVFRMPVLASAAVDNFHNGGIAAPIALETGLLGQATSLGTRPDTTWHDVHPATGGQIRGRTLPYWREVVALVQAAHAAFPDLVTLGWDVAILEDGPCLIEANKGPDVDLIQRPHAAPLGSSRFGRLLAFHLERSLRARYPDTWAPPIRAQLQCDTSTPAS